MTRDKLYEFKGFKPDDFLREYVVKTVNDLYLSAPSDSSLYLVAEKSKSAFRATCRIASQVGVFTAEAFSNSALNAVKQVEKRIDYQLRQWKRNRFTEHSINQNADNLILAS